MTSSVGGTLVRPGWARQMAVRDPTEPHVVVVQPWTSDPVARVGVVMLIMRISRLSLAVSWSGRNKVPRHDDGSWLPMAGRPAADGESRQRSSPAWASAIASGIVVQLSGRGRLAPLWGYLPSPTRSLRAKKGVDESTSDRRPRLVALR